jgi:hypothetical protein
MIKSDADLAWHEALTEAVGIRMEANMWIALFNSIAIFSTISITVATCLSMAAFVLPSPNRAGDVKALSRNANWTGLPIRVAKSPMPDADADTVLLLRRMQSLRLDPDEFRSSEPIMFRELLLRCEACESRVSCASDLADKSTSDRGEDWRDYCPNGATLNALSLLREVATLADRPRH